VYEEAPGFPPGPRERGERRFRVYEEAPGFRDGLRARGRDASVCMRRHQAHPLAAVEPW